MVTVSSCSHHAHMAAKKTYDKCTNVLGDLNITTTAKQPLKVTLLVWKHQRYYPLVRWSDTLFPTDAHKHKVWSWRFNNKRIESINDVEAGDGWTWIETEWQPVVDEMTTDPNGWSYAVDWNSRFTGRATLAHLVRKRCFARTKVQTSLTHDEQSRAESVRNFFARYEAFQQDIQAERANPDVISLKSVCW